MRSVDWGCLGWGVVVGEVRRVEIEVVAGEVVEFV